MRIDHNSHQQLVYPKPLPEHFPVKTSVIIGNYNHSKMVVRLVDNLFYGVKRDDETEIIIGDSGSDKENQFIIFDLMEQYKGKFPIKYIYCDLSKERAEIPKFHGAVFCVNAAARVAKHDILIYCDSSIILPPSFLFELSSPHCGSMHGFVRAPLLNINMGDVVENEDDRKQPDYYQKLKDKFWGTKSHGRPTWSIRKEDYILLGGMDEEMRYYGIGDDDLVTRCIMRGYGNWMSETEVLHIYHPEPRDDNNHYNARLMQEHINNFQFVVNREKAEWGTYTWVKTND